MKEITERQKDVLFFISDFIEKNSYPPAVRDISNAFGVSVKAVQDHLLALEKKGYIEHIPGISRSIKVLRQKEKTAVDGDEQSYVIVLLIPVNLCEPVTEKVQEQNPEVVEEI